MVEVPNVGAIVEQIRARIGEIEKQLEQHRDLTEELEHLRGALERLEGGVRARVRARRPRAAASPQETTAAAKAPATAKEPAAAKGHATGTRSAAARRPGRPAAPAPRGQTRAKVLEALKQGPKTAGDIAKETGIGRGSVSTTLTNLAKAGKVLKAERGYRLP
jgi:predicted Rossmann fold nucleotide-binding protein DprA/Smf involved in DNA uptake